MKSANADFMRPAMEDLADKKDKTKADRIKLLLVDDEVAYVNVLSNRMGRRNIDVTKALSGTEGIQALRGQDFDVAIVDLKMEDMDGLEVLRVFKKMVPHMPVIMLTGHGSEQAARAGIELGAYDYLIKPCDFEDLIGKIKDAVGSGR
jgi:DNA-binding NtrC family response regulator